MPLDDLFVGTIHSDWSEHRASRRERHFAAITLAAIASLVLIAAAADGTKLAASEQTALFLTTLGWVGVLLTSLLLIFRARLVKNPGGTILAYGYSFGTVCFSISVVAFHGIAIWYSPEATFWTTFVGREGILISITLYALSRPEAASWFRAGVVTGAGLAGAAVGAGILGPTAFGLTLFGANGTFTTTASTLNAVLLGTALTAGVLLALRTRLATSLDLWLWISACAVVAYDITKFLGHGNRLLIPEMMARISYVIFGFVVLAALLIEFARLISRRHALDQFRSLGELSGTIVSLLDDSGACAYVNRRWTEVTGQAAEDALEDGWRQCVHPDDVGAVDAAHRSELSAGGARYSELRLRGPAGVYRWHLAETTPIKTSAGRTMGYYRTVMDVDSQRRAQEESQNAIARERHISRTLQTAFLPPLLPQAPGLQIDAHYAPAPDEAQIGGDWYDAFILRDGRVALSIGDVTGHGLEAAGVMVRLRESIRALTGIFGEPSTILSFANRALMDSDPSAIATALLAIFDPESGRVSVARAGHPPPAIIADSLPAFMPSRAGLPLGVSADEMYLHEEAQLNVGDAIVLYTDGMLEGNRDVLAGEQRLLEILRSRPKSAQALTAAVTGGSHRDDVAVLCLCITGGRMLSSWRFSSDDALSASDSREAFTAHLRRRNVDEEAIATATLVFGELVGNVVQHAPGPIEVELEWDDESPLLTIRDRGPEFTPGSPALPADPFAEGGRGLYIISMFAEPPTVIPRPGGGNEVAVRLPRSALVSAGT